MPLEQPNFQQIAERLVAVGKELSLCANMPAMQQGQAIIDAINALDRDLRQEMQELRQEIRELRQEMGEHIGGIHKRLDKFTLEMRARDANCHVRLANSRLVTERDLALEPLSSIITGDLIPDFPLTLDKVRRLTSDEADGILIHLGHNMNGATVAAKRERIEKLCGLY